MKRTKLKDRQLPTYTKGEEIFNMVTHIVGGGLGAIVIILCCIFAGIHHNAYGIFSGVIFGISMIIVYTFSSIYHGLKKDTTAKKVFQVLDHCAIAVLIAGSYTPFTLCTIRQYNSVIGWSMFGILWGITALSITLNAIDLKKFRVFSMICYLTMGWCIIFKIGVIYQMLGTAGFSLLLAGGIIYTIGAVFYGVGRKIKYMHSIFHLCILIANFLHFLCILLFVM